MRCSKCAEAGGMATRDGLCWDCFFGARDERLREMRPVRNEHETSAPPPKEQRRGTRRVVPMQWGARR